MLVIAAALVTLPSVAAAQAPPSPEQRLAVYAKPSVVRVQSVYIGTFDVAGSKFHEAIGGSGTGWFITPDGYIATNAHVVADVHAGDDVAKKALFSELFAEIEKTAHDQLARMSDRQKQQLVDSIKLTDLQKWEYVVLPNGDHLDYEVKAFGKPGTGQDAAIIKVKIENAPTLPIGDSTKSQVEDKIIVIGYPGVADAKDLLDEKSQLEASVTDGAISSLKRSSTGEQILQISAPITHGNSGGPAIDSNGQVVGLATFGNEGDVQGFNFLVASATLMDMVKEQKIENRPSDTNRAWREGLELFWDQEYSDAITKFEEVQALFPTHSEALNFIKTSNQAKKDGKEKKPASNGGMIAGIVIGSIVVLGGIVMIARRGKKRGGPAPVGPTMMMQPQQPGMMQQPGMQQPGMMQPGMQQPGMQQPGMQQPGQAGMSGPMGMVVPPGMQMIGGLAQPNLPVAKTVAVGPGGPQQAPVPATAFGAFSIGSLACTRGLLAGQRFALTAQGILIGRQPGVAQIVVNDHRASAKHVWIGLEQGKIVCIDQGTTNGTFVNDVARGRISRAELRSGDTIIVAEPDVLSLQLFLT